MLDSLEVHPVEELPPLIYQLLLLCSRGHKQLVLARVIGHIGQLEPTPTPANLSADGQDSLASLGSQMVSTNVAEGVLTAQRLRPVQGTCILHITFAAKQDQELGRAFVKFLKSKPKLTAFSIALALSMARIHRWVPGDSFFRARTQSRVYLCTVQRAVACI